MAAVSGVSESSTLSNSYSYSLGWNSPTDDWLQSGGDANAVTGPDLVLTTPDSSALGLNFTATLKDGSFEFLHTGFCVGTCTATITTDIVFTLTNTGSTDAYVRFDSLITPGLLARFNTAGQAYCECLGDGFDFSVTQTSKDQNHELYYAYGSAAPLSRNNLPFTSTSDDMPFTDQKSDDKGFASSTVDWGATILTVDLDPIAPGETTTLTYHSKLELLSAPEDQVDCTDLITCTAYQVAFGDPRDKGVATNALAAFAAPFGSVLAASEPSDPFGDNFQIFDPYSVPYTFAPQGSPIPHTRSEVGVVEYLGAVPEPASWAMLITGFIGIGSAMRRSKRLSVRVA